MPVTRARRSLRIDEAAAFRTDTLFALAHGAANTASVFTGVEPYVVVHEAYDASVDDRVRRGWTVGRCLGFVDDVAALAYRAANVTTAGEPTAIAAMLNVVQVAGGPMTLFPAAGGSVTAKYMASSSLFRVGIREDGVVATLYPSLAEKGLLNLALMASEP